MKNEYKTVEWMRARRRQIDEEDQGLSWDEKRARAHEAVMQDPVFNLMIKRVHVPPVAGTKVSEEPGVYQTHPKNK